MLGGSCLKNLKDNMIPPIIPQTMTTLEHQSQLINWCRVRAGCISLQMHGLRIENELKDGCGEVIVL